LHAINLARKRCILGLDLVELHANDNEKITNISMMKSLKILNASRNCGIDQSSIFELDLIELRAYNNDKILNISMMKSLKKLNAGGSKCGIALFFLLVKKKSRSR
jgi:hypothetical protein